MPASRKASPKGRGKSALGKATKKTPPTKKKAVAAKRKTPATKKVAAKRKAASKSKIVASPKASTGSKSKIRIKNRSAAPPRRTPKNRPMPGARGRKQRRTRSGLAAFASMEAEAAPFWGGINSVKAAKFLVGLLLLPLCWVSLETFLALFRTGTIGRDFWTQPEFLFFAAGVVVAGAVFFAWRSRFLVWLYVAGHELTHAIFVLICRGNVSKIHISSQGGHILTNRNNFLISLSPYFFPFYTVVVIAVWALLEWQLFDFRPEDACWLYGLIGLTWMFHLAFTVWMVGREQPDVEQNGKLFSFSVIFLANMLVISAMLVAASPTATFRGYGRAFVSNAESFGVRLWESVSELVNVLPGMVG